MCFAKRSSHPYFKPASFPPNPWFLFPGHMFVPLCPYLEEVLIRLWSWVKHEELGDFIKSVDWWSSSQLISALDFSLHYSNKTIQISASQSFTLPHLFLLSVFLFTLLFGKLRHTVYVSVCLVPEGMQSKHRENKKDGEGSEMRADNV